MNQNRRKFQKCCRKYEKLRAADSSLKKFFKRKEENELGQSFKSLFSPGSKDAEMWGEVGFSEILITPGPLVRKPTLGSSF